jgi:outer membrane protein OmpA-like peptidoglycan-associated protein
MTLKRYQPARKRKRSSKKNRPLKLAVAIGVVGIAAGVAYLSLHGEMLMAVVDGTLDLPDRRFGPLSAHFSPKADPKAQAPKLAHASPAAVKTVAHPLKASPAAPASTAPMLGSASPKPSAFPENGQPAAEDDPIAEASPLKPAGEASFAPAKVAVKPVVHESPQVAVKQVAKASPVPVQKASPKVQPSPKLQVAAKPQAPAKPQPAAKPQLAAPAGGQRLGSLYFDKNSSYLSGAEQDRLARLVSGLKQRSGTIHVSGFADSLGDAGYNRWMAQRRASRVAELIRSQTGGKVNVVVDAVGSVGNAGGADGDRQNRRVEVEVR